jgi:STE24 endopeptidase
MEKAKKYWRIKRQLFLIDIILNMLVLYAVLFSRATIILRNMAMGLTDNPFAYIALYLLWLGVFIYIATFGLEYYEGFVLEHKFALSSQPFLRWFKRHLKRGIIGGIISLIIAEAVYFLLRRYPQNWWALAGIGWILFTIILSRLAPVLIIPVFYKYSPLNNEELKKRLIRLAETTGAHVKGVFRINMSKETKKANAALVGMGKTRRIIIGDTLLDNFNNDEIEVVLAHELGHHKKLHLWKLLAFGTVITFIGLFSADVIMKKYLRYFGFNDISDIGAFPLLCLLVLGFSLLAMPLQNGFSRYLERRADMFALKTTGKPDAFISTMTKLAKQNLSDTTPNRLIEILMYNHPPVSRRIQMAEDFKANA